MPSGAESNRAPPMRKYAKPCFLPSQKHYGGVIRGHPRPLICLWGWYARCGREGNRTPLILNHEVQQLIFPFLPKWPVRLRFKPRTGRIIAIFAAQTSNNSNMSKFLTLHKFNSDTIYYVNADSISCLYTSGNKTIIYLACGKMLEVSELSTMILDRIEETFPADAR